MLSVNSILDIFDNSIPIISMKNRENSYIDIVIDDCVLIAFLL